MCSITTKMEVSIPGGNTPQDVWDNFKQSLEYNPESKYTIVYNQESGDYYVYEIIHTID